MNTSSTSGGRRHAKRLRITSALPPFWELVASERVWRVIEHVEAAVPTFGRRCGYTLMDIVVMDVAAQLFGSNRAAERDLGGPQCLGAAASPRHDGIPEGSGPPPVTARAEPPGALPGTQSHKPLRSGR